MLNQIFKFFKVFRHLGLSDLAKLQSVASLANFKEGELIAQEGDRFPYFVLIRSGIIRTYLITPGGEERTTRLAKEGDISACSQCVFGNGISNEYLYAVEPIKALLINVEQFKRLAKNDLGFQKVLNDGLADAFLEAVERIQFFTLLNPEERYKYLLDNAPDLLRRVPQKYLASYLGVTTVSLSRIRSRVSKQ